MDFDQFQHSHSAQLANIPNQYWRALYEKLQYEVYDAGKHFCMNNGSGGWEVVVSSEEEISTEDPSCIFLVDHAWTFQASWARRHLEVISGLAERIGGLMGLIEVKKEEASNSEDSYDADSESGNEKEEWSDSDKEAEDDSLKGIAQDPQQLQFKLKEECDSGDLGDVSHAYVTDTPGKPKESLPSTKVARKKKRKHAEGKRRSAEDIKEEEEEEEEKEAVLRPTCTVKGDKSGETSEVVVSVPNQKLLQDILHGMWRYCHAYHISNSVVPMWYVMDEFGSRINHSTNPTIAMQCFFFIPTQLAYSIIWPLKKLSKGDFVTCNYLPASVKPGLAQACHSIPWSPDTLTLADPLWKDLDKCCVPDIEERCSESLPDPATPSPSPMLNYNVYTDIKLVETFLKHPSFHIVSSRKDADILWLSDHFKDFTSLGPGQMVNQFPCESVLTCKDLLASVATKGNGGVAPDWLPVTFNLLYELPKLVQEYLKRKEKGEDNLWIIKPWNLGRSLDIHISDNLYQIVRLAQVGPKVGCKYISNPVLFHRSEVGWVKFDYRYMILLNSVKPLEVYVYDVFWLRFANKPFNLERKALSEYEVHFTVMNYDSNVELKQIHYNDFIPLFEEQNPSYKWSTIQEDTIQLLKELMVSATSGTRPRAISPFGPSRAIYAADLMLEKITPSDPEAPPIFRPRLLEINYCPDCVRACKYHPDFFNHMFEVLFMGVTDGIPVHRIV